MWPIRRPNAPRGPRNVERVSSKRNRNKKAWARKRKAGKPNADAGQDARPPTWRVSRPPVAIPDEPTELDQIGVLIVEGQLGLPTTDMAGLRAMASKLPFEPCMSLLANLAGKVEQAIDRPAKQLAIAEGFFGPSELVERYRALIKQDPKAHIFGPQSLYTLMRIIVDDAYDAPIAQELTPAEKLALIEAVVASNSVTERGTDAGVGPSGDDLLAYELQIGHYYSRPPWMEEMARAHELYRLATEDEDLLKSRDCVPVKDWISRAGATAEEQWALGFGLSSTANAWDGEKHPHVPMGVVDELLERAGLSDRRESALGAIAADRAAFQAAFTELHASGKRFIWELRPFNTWPFLRLHGTAGLLLLGRPWMLSWLSEGFHYRAMRVAQAEDAAATDGRTDHVQRYTAFAGQVFEAYCLGLAREGVPEPALVMGEQEYGKGGGQKTSDVAVLIGDDLVLFEVNARRVGAEPLLTGDPLDVSEELTKLLVKKINQLGVTIGALVDGTATLADVDMSNVKRIIPVVVSAGRLWQTSNLWTYLDRARDTDKCKPFEEGRVEPLQAIDGGEYERLLALAYHGGHLGELLARKASGPYRHRDLAVWLAEDKPVPDHHVRLPAVNAIFQSMISELEPLYGTRNDS